MSDDSTETSDLLHQAAAGDESAVDRLFARHIPRVSDRLRRRIAGNLRVRIDASDVVSESHWIARKQLGQFLVKRPMPFGVWLLKTARQRLIEQCRRHVHAAKRSIRREVAMPEGSSWFGLARMRTGRHIDSKELPGDGTLLHHVREGLAQLSQEDQRIISLRVFESQSNKEAAETLQISQEAAKKRYFRAIIRLRHQLSLEGWD